MGGGSLNYIAQTECSFGRVSTKFKNVRPQIKIMQAHKGITHAKSMMRPV